MAIHSQEMTNNLHELEKMLYLQLAIKFKV